MRKLYLDNAATTRPVDGIAEKLMTYITDYYHNPSAVYSDAQKVREDIEEVRYLVANEIGADPSEIYFTSGAAEANNWAIQGWDMANTPYKCTIFLHSYLEHKSIESFSYHIDRQFSRVLGFLNDIKGKIEYADTINTLKKWWRNGFYSLVSIIFANNEIGTIQNIKEISDIVHEHNGTFHTDATQAFGHIPINVKEMGIDMMSASAQKIGGLKGTGFLYVKNGINISPLIYGSQEKGMRGGTENVLGIISLGEAIKNIDYSQNEAQTKWRDDIIAGLEELGCKLNGHRTDRLPNNISVILPYGISSQAFVLTLDAAGIQISGGSACNQLTGESSHVLAAIGLTDKEIGSTIRITLPDMRTLEDKPENLTDRILTEFKKAIELLR